MNQLTRGQGWLLHGGLLAIAVAFPFVFSSSFAVNFGVLALFYAFIGQSWNISGGFAGQLSFGQVWPIRISREDRVHAGSGLAQAGAAFATQLLAGDGRSPAYHYHRLYASLLP